MEYIKGEPFFCQASKKIKAYTYINHDTETDILIIGAGIDGSILNYFISQKYDVTLVEKSRIGLGCSSCATALLEYQLDDYADNLRTYLSEEEIISAYNSGLTALDTLNNTIKKLGNKCEYSKRPTLLYTNNIFAKT
ncbi:MAG: FAD-dependent oxidoreductase, partial [Clostridia bacterium]